MSYRSQISYIANNEPRWLSVNAASLTTTSAAALFNAPMISSQPRCTSGHGYGDKETGVGFSEGESV